MTPRRRWRRCGGRTAWSRRPTRGSSSTSTSTSVEPETLDAAAVRQALVRLLEEPAYAAAAALAQSEIRAMPAHGEVVVALEHLADRSPATACP